MSTGTYALTIKLTRFEGLLYKYLTGFQSPYEDKLSASYQRKVNEHV